MIPHAHNRWVIYVSLAFAVTLAALPLPPDWHWYAPQWVELVLIYWVLKMPYQIGIGTAFVTGILVDIVLGGVLGRNALALSIVVYFALLSYQRLRMLYLWQQSLTILMLVVLSQVIRYWVLGLSGIYFFGPSFLYSALTSALSWPLVVLVLAFVRRFMAVS